MKFVEFRCSEVTEETYKKFFQDFIRDFKGDIEKICAIRNIQFTGNLFYQLTFGIYKMIKYERVRTEKLGISIEVIRVELRIIDDRVIQFLIRSLNADGKPIFENDINCVRSFFSSGSLNQN